MNQPLLTVIVPCYNVEKYMDKCILSIVNQIYSNLEIILIDDGSTDGTGKICDEWQEKDQRLRAIHTQNEGAACARNRGIKDSKADYVTFVDPDDWIDANMYSDMMSAMLSTRSDVAQCGVYEVYEDGNSTEVFTFKEVSNIQTYQRVEAVIMFLKEKWFQSLCNKIYKKNLFDNVPTHKGRICGNDQLDYILFHYSSQTVVLNNAYYFYFQRSDSVSRHGNIRKEMKKICDLSDLYFERFSFTKQHVEYHEALPHTKCLALFFGIFTIRNTIAYPHYTAKEYIETKIGQIRSTSLSKEDQLLHSLKIEYHLLKINPKLHKYLLLLYFHIIRVTNHLNITKRQKFHTAFLVYDLIFKHIKIFKK